MAEYTGAQETIPLGKKATKERDRQRKEGMLEMINDFGEDSTEDEDMVEWELAQVRRGEQGGRKQPAASTGGKKRPYRPAPSTCGVPRSDLAVTNTICSPPTNTCSFARIGPNTFNICPQ